MLDSSFYAPFSKKKKQIVKNPSLKKKLAQSCTSKILSGAHACGYYCLFVWVFFGGGWVGRNLASVNAKVKNVEDYFAGEVKTFRRL